MALEHYKAEIRAWQSALQANDTGDFRGALRLFEPISDGSKILVNVALIHDRLGERAEAVDNFSKAIELDKYLAIGYFQRGVCYFKSEQYPEAVQDFSEAEVTMRTNNEINYGNLGLNYKLRLQEILFNKWLALSRMGKERESSVVLQAIREASLLPELEAMVRSAAKNPAEGTPCSLPVGTLFRPPASKMQMLNAASQSLATTPITHPRPTSIVPSLGTTSSSATPHTAAQITRSPSSVPSLSTVSGKDMGNVPAQTARSAPRAPSPRRESTCTESTLMPSVTSRMGGYQRYRKHKSSAASSYKSPSSDDLPDMSTVVHVPKRLELNRVVGADLMKPMNDIQGIPCAGVRISHGILSGLMAWRFVVRLGGADSPAVVANFILDTGSKDTYVPPVVLDALGYRGKLNPGAEVTLRLQGVKTKCIVAHPEDAGRLGISFTTAGSLTYYFDEGLTAPVLYDGSGERPANVPRTIMPRRPWLVVLRFKFCAMVRGVFR
ncbi:hypothetical protein DFH06DRAFT_109470 [Mycena polygramma]|nr:hypothetical protein DFH06DRAFT_109470 [Mycena polygramma]